MKEIAEDPNKFAIIQDEIKSNFNSAVESGGEYIMIQVTNYANSTKTTKQYRLSDFTNDSKNLYPKLDISKDINLMGSYFDSDDNKAYTEFKIKVDWLAV